MTTTLRRLTALVAPLALIGMLMALMAGPAKATNVPGVQEFEANVSTSQAGGHPNVALHFKVLGFEMFVDPPCGKAPECLMPKTFHTHFPTGFIGNPHVVPKCTLTDYNQQACPSDSQVGVMDVGGALQAGLKLIVPVYNMETRPDQAGLLAFYVPLLSSPVFLELSGRTDSDYGLDVVSSELLPLPVKEVHGYLWGVPADPSHDKLRFVTPLQGLAACFEQSAGPPPPFGEFENCENGEPGTMGIGSTVPPLPYTQNPTTCGVPLEATFDVLYYNGKSASASWPFPGMTGCQQMSFNPALTVEPTTTQTDSPSGLDTILKVPQPQSAETSAASELLVSRFTLPEGFSLNPSAADGKVACPDSASAIGTLFASNCPEFSKVGSVVLDVAALPAPLPGALYIAEPKPGDRFRLLLSANGFATNVKLLGSVRPDPQTGQLEILFENLPQSPLQEFNVHVFGSERGFLATPPQCGTFPVEGEFVPWNSELTTRKSLSYITVTSGPGGSPCPNGPRPFAPNLTAGSATTTAGAHSPFSLTVTRNDGEQNLTGISVRAPRGMAATLKGVPYCSDATLAAIPSRTGAAESGSPSCPSASQIGTATAGAGAGSHQVYVPGRTYLAGPYKGAPLSLAVVLPALSGPYDLGNVVVRAAIHVDPVTAEITTVSDPLPQILEGVPLRARYVLINLDRPKFTLNPTNCDTFPVRATITGNEGATSSPSSHYQAANCAELPYSPRLSLKLSGGVKRRGHPAVRATFVAGQGESNTRRISVALPKGQLLDNGHIDTICTRPQFAADNCPAGSRIGSAEAATPLLDQPLRGGVYLRSSNNDLPDMVMDLEGQIDIELAGRIDTVKGGALRTTFATVPDAPVSAFTVSLEGGAKGLIQNSETLCGKAKRATVRMRGQNGATHNTRPKLKTTCGSKARGKRGKRPAGQRKAG